jgi:hypothetical protein
VPETGIEPVRPLCRKAADFKSDVSTNFTTRAITVYCETKMPRQPEWTRARNDQQTNWRRDPESNRARRICNPLHNRFAIAPLIQTISTTFDKKGKPGSFPFWKCGAGKESRTLDLNLGKVALYQLSYSRVSSLKL